VSVQQIANAMIDQGDRDLRTLHVETRDLVAAVNQQLGEMPTDETRAARD